MPHWSEAVKRLWDADTRARRPLNVVLLGSAPLLVRRGLTESLAGRFEIVHLPHWTWAEMQEAFEHSQTMSMPDMMKACQEHRQATSKTIDQVTRMISGPLPR